MHLPPALILSGLAAVPGLFGKVYKIDQYCKWETGSLGAVPTGTRSWVSDGKPTFGPSRPHCFTLLTKHKHFRPTLPGSAFFLL